MAKNSRETRFLYRRNGPTDQQTNGWTARLTDGWTDGRTDRPSYRDAFPTDASKKKPRNKKKDELNELSLRLNHNVATNLTKIATDIQDKSSTQYTCHFYAISAQLTIPPLPTPTFCHLPCLPFLCHPSKPNPNPFQVISLPSTIPNISKIMDFSLSGWIVVLNNFMILVKWTQLLLTTWDSCDGSRLNTIESAKGSHPLVKWG